MNNKTLKITLNVFIWTMFAIALLVVIGTLNTNDDGISSVAGIGYLSVQSDSMEPEFKEGDMIFVKTTSSDDVFEQGDIVTFRTTISGQPALNTHEIVQVEEIAGTNYYTTQGVNPNISEPDSGTITAGDIVAQYTGNKLSRLGNVIDFLQTRTGFFVVIVMPLALLFLYQIIHSSLLIAGYRQSGSGKTDLDKLSDEEKAKIAEAYMKSKEESKK